MNTASKTIISKRERNVLKKDTLKSRSASGGELPQGAPHLLKPGQKVTKQIEKLTDLQDYYELPASYNSTNLTLIARDPYWIYAYWEIAQTSLEDIRNKVGAQISKADYVLRMYDVTYIDFNGTNANRTFDIEINPKANNWYINLWNDNATYCADLGLRLPDGRFFQLARSNFVTTPRLRPSNRSEEVWMKVKDNRAEPPFVMGYLNAGRRRTQAKPIQRQLSNKGSESIRAKGLNKITLTEADIRTYYSKLSPLLRDVIAKRLAKYNPKRSEANKSEPQRLSLYARGPIKDLMHSQLVKKLLAGASEELLWGASESIFSGASEQHLHLGEAGGRKFFFEIGTELIVYGRTEPDAKVELGEKNVKLHRDGTFNMRFALPEGKIPLDFVAKSADGTQRREISTKVERTKTRYNP